MLKSKISERQWRYPVGVILYASVYSCAASLNLPALKCSLPNSFNDIACFRSSGDDLHCKRDLERLRVSLSDDNL